MFTDVRRRRHTVLSTAVGMALALLLTLLPAALLAAPAPQEGNAGEPTRLLLGEMGAAQVAAGESVSFVVEAPVDGLYVITSGDDAEAAKFTLVVTHERGEEVYNGAFATTEIELDDGDHTLTATAAEDGVLSIVVTGQIGDLSEEWGDGDMVNGGFVVAENVANPLYAQLSIAESPYWQRAMILIQGDGDSYSASVSGGSAYASIDDSATGDMLTFFTRGGEYDLQVAPINGGGALTVIPFLSGPIPPVAPGEEASGEFSAESTEAYYQFEVTEAGALVTVEVASDSEDADIDMAVALQPGIEPWTSTASGSNERVQFMAPVAGTYIVRIYTYSEAAATYTLRVEQGELAPELVLGERTWADVDAGASAIYRLNVDEPGKVLTVYLVGSEGQNLDMTVILIDEEGNQDHYLSTYSEGSVEVVAQANAGTGLYEVRVRNDYGDTAAGFVLLAQTLGAEDIARQWAVDAVASSQYGDDGFSALQATGEPNVTAPSDNPAAWASKEADGALETLELTFARAVRPSGVRIHESYNPGAVTTIEAFDEESGEWVVLWEGNEPTEEAMRVFSPSFQAPDFATAQIRLTLDTSVVGGWNEIDAVELVGRP